MNFDDPTLRDIFASFGKNRMANKGGYHKRTSCSKTLSSEINFIHCNIHEKINSDFNDSSLLPPIEELCFLLQINHIFIVKKLLLPFDFHTILWKK